MKRRQFLLGLSGVQAARLLRQQGPPRPDPLEKMTLGPESTIALCHAGYAPGSQKRIIVRDAAARTSEMRDIGSGPPFRIEIPLTSVSSDLGLAAVGDFSQVTREGLRSGTKIDTLTRA